MSGKASIAKDSPYSTPSEERLFTDWSSLESPSARTSPQSVPIRETGQDSNEPDNQITQPGSETAQIGTTGNALHDDINVTSPRTCQQPDELGVRMINIGTNTSDIAVTPQRDGLRIITLEGNAQASCPLVDVILPTGMNKQVPMPHINLSISGYDPESLRKSHIRTQDTGIQENSTILQLNGPVSIPIRDRRLLENIRIEQEYPQEGTYLQETSVSCRREYPGDSSDDNRSYRD